MDSQETVGENGAATNAFDGKSTTLWHTRWSSSAAPLPHEIQINLGATYNLTGFRYLPRQDGKSNGRIGQFEFYVSTDGANWEVPVATGNFTNSATEKQILFSAVNAKFIRLRARSEANGSIFTSCAELNVLRIGDGTSVISRTNWSLKFVDSQELVGENGAATNCFDNSTSTFWHTQWFNGQPPMPHEIQIDLGATYNVNGFRYLPRQDGKTNGRVARYEFYVSADGSNWGAAVATGTFANTASQQESQFSTKAGRYVRLRVLSEVNGAAYCAIADFNVLQTNATPTAD